MCILKCITWQQNDYAYEEHSSVIHYEPVFDSEALAHQHAEALVDMWLEPENGDITRFVNGRDHGAYVNDGHNSYHGVRITIE